MTRKTEGNHRKKIIKRIEAGETNYIKFDCKKLELTLVWKCPCCTRANGLWWKFHRDLREAPKWLDGNHTVVKSDTLKCYHCKRKFKFMELPMPPKIRNNIVGEAHFVKKRKKR